jgi:hypothetical protein
MSTQLPEIFEPENQEGNAWDLIPDGEYMAQIVEASVVQPKSLDGYHLALIWKISEGDYENRQVWQRITFTHSSEQARLIGRKTLKDLCSALEIAEHVKDVEVFLFKPARVKVGIEKDENGVYDDKNVIKRILPLNPPTPGGTAPPKAAASHAAAKPQSGATTKGAMRAGPAGSAPWHQRRS